MVPPKLIPPEVVTKLSRQQFTRKEVASLLGVAEITLKRRMKLYNIKVIHVNDTDTAISDDELNERVKSILEEHPNTEMKMMAGFLRSQGMNVQGPKVRASVRAVYVIGVAARRSRTCLISSRVYFVTFSNEKWHVDTNLKLIRYKFVIKSCVDGKGRTSIYLDVDDNIGSDFQLNSFLKGVRDYGVHLRTRSDKGLENRGLAEFMLKTRGLGRGSNICGRSVHNQRIERHWVDVYSKVILQFSVTFNFLESQGLLDTNSEFHMAVLHYVFLPRIQTSLHSFCRGWNEHCLRTANGISPNQLLLMHSPPADRDLCIAQEIQDSSLFTCNTLEDAQKFNEQSPITQLTPRRYQFLEADLLRLRNVNVERRSQNFGIDIYCKCLHLLTSYL